MDLNHTRIGDAPTFMYTRYLPDCGCWRRRYEKEILEKGGTMPDKEEKCGRCRLIIITSSSSPHHSSLRHNYHFTIFTSGRAPL
jgi:hypothetical protein